MAEPKPKRQLSRLGRLFGVREAGGDVPVAAAASAGGAQAAEPSGDRSGTTTPEHAVRSPALSPRTSRSAVPPVAASPPGASGGAPLSPARLALADSLHQPPTVRSGLVSRTQSARGSLLRAPASSGSVATAAAGSGAALALPGVSRNSSVSAQKPANGVHHNLGALAPGNAAMNNKPRFRVLDGGYHEHNLRSAKRQEKLLNMLKDLLGAKKLRDEAKSEVPNILGSDTAAAVGGAAAGAAAKPPTLFAGLVSQVKNDTLPYHGAVPPRTAEQQDLRSFVEKYGRCQEVIGKGSFGVVRVSHKKTDGDGATHGAAAGLPNGAGEVLYAVKEFKRKPGELDQKYNRRLTSEFCISLSLKHRNIIETLDLLKDAKGDYCEVMEFCLGGDLYTLIIALGKLEYAEADCFFKQLIRGVNYMHDMGVSHRDLKPENLLLTQRGVLKITDFGNGECFKMAWESEIQLSEGVCGLSPYIAPEEFTQRLFDPRGVDIWACGVIYMAMRTGRQLWKLADPKKDEFFHEYLVQRKDALGYEPIELLKRARCRNVIYSILDPKPERRITGRQILNSEWGREIKVCAAASEPASEQAASAASGEPAASEMH
jgi:protein-serine/threonine kinase